MNTRKDAAALSFGQVKELTTEMLALAGEANDVSIDETLTMRDSSKAAGESRGLAKAVQMILATVAGNLDRAGTPGPSVGERERRIDAINSEIAFLKSLLPSKEEVSDAEPDTPAVP